MEEVEEKREKKNITLRLFPEEDLVLEKIKKKYGISKSEQIETLIKKYAREEYGAY
ncbi:hypothetical protein GCM10022378_15190 [Salinicoccus jeotgali]|jgi:3-methyladenine DNA glycosylase/8-oxoguanine DNA glycosylase|uniref:Antitoxin MazE n=1 Tax=Salinicoccus jeotgali TaxID=381634 RepID=A0ABP7EX35_9STAP